MAKHSALTRANGVRIPADPREWSLHSRSLKTEEEHGGGKAIHFARLCPGSSRGDERWSEAPKGQVQLLDGARSSTRSRP
jgi:hypothetical protein